LLVLDDERAEVYSWAKGTQNLLYDLAAIRTESDVLGFVRRYGPLYGGRANDDEWGPETFGEWVTSAQDLSLVLYKYATLRHVADGDAIGRRELAEYFASTVYLGLPWSGLWEVDESQRELRDEAREMLSDNARVDVSELVDELREELEQDLLSGLGHPYLSHPQGVELGVGRVSELEFSGTTPYPGGEFILAAYPNDLVQLAYFQLALDMTQAVEMRICPVDNKIFPLRDPRQKYCSPQCGGRARYRRFAAKKK
jgi:hypothetical protein